MSDLSLPLEAADWAHSWLRGANSLTGIRYSRASAVRRVQRAIDELASSQPDRCAAGLAVLRAILAAEVE